MLGLSSCHQHMHCDASPGIEGVTIGVSSKAFGAIPSIDSECICPSMPLDLVSDRTMMGGASNLKLEGAFLRVQIFAVRASNGATTLPNHEVISQVLCWNLSLNQSSFSVSLPAVVTASKEVGALVEIDHPCRKDLLHGSHFRHSKKPLCHPPS